MAVVSAHSREYRYLPRDAMRIRAVFAVARYLSIRPSVCPSRSCILHHDGWRYRQFVTISRPGSPIITLRAKLSGAVYCYRSCLWACLQQAGGRCPLQR